MFLVNLVEQITFVHSLKILMPEWQTCLPEAGLVDTLGSSRSESTVLNVLENIDARVAKLVDALRSGRSAGNGMLVRIRSRALSISDFYSVQ